MKAKMATGMAGNRRTWLPMTRRRLAERIPDASEPSRRSAPASTEEDDSAICRNAGGPLNATTAAGTGRTKNKKKAFERTWPGSIEPRSG